MIALYGLPTDFPGYEDAQRKNEGIGRPNNSRKDRIVVVATKMYTFQWVA